MKKIQRSFVVEHKHGRRKADLKSNSIWGNMDLKSLARRVKEETMPFPSATPHDSITERKASSPEMFPAIPSLTRLPAQLKTASDAQETSMADETDTMTHAEAEAPAVETPIAPKQQRKPRAKKAAPETAAASKGIPGKQKRGPKIKGIDGADSAKRTYVKRSPRAAQTSTSAETAAIDALTDLLQLEEENQRLRKLLAEKLRAENADLRRRLELD
ncbi:transcriptional regulator [Neorhizobium lilium]|uniref:Transcriptional regulator n=1 Tax=Neorhizobium lilium TaxID=2503024 RepID=A0A444LMD1_9HYPH|nr:transcriptional regulator [Neorhizobium lilium]RWX81474.1 transcriptional regulator [Neorhizobium lilium]